MSTYVTCEPDVHERLQSLLKNHRRELADIHEAEVTFLLQFAHAPRDANTGEPRGPALKFANYPAAAIIRVTTLKDRVAGLPDCRIEIDGDNWPEWPEERRLATLHHELTHVMVRRDDKGAVLSDDCGRPKIRLRPHDFQLGGFYSIVERYGQSSFEAEAAAKLFQDLHQQNMAWG